MEIEGDDIAKFYQRELPKEIFNEREFFLLMNEMMVENDLLTDLEKSYKVKICLDKALNVD